MPIQTLLQTEFEITYPNPTEEILDNLSKHDLLDVINFEIRDFLLGRRPDQIPRYGDGLTLALAKLMRGLALKDSDDPNRLEILGYSPDDILTQIRGREEICTILQQEEANYNFQGVRKHLLDHLPFLAQIGNPQLYQWEASRIFFGLIQDGLTPITTSSIPVFTLQRSNTRWENCKDSEVYFYQSLFEKDAWDSITFLDSNGEPIFFQKSGHYRDNFKSSNRTALSLVPVVINGVLIPRGTLFGIDSQAALTHQEECQFRDYRQVEGVFPLRPTLFCLPPEEASISFGSHYTSFSSYVADSRYILNNPDYELSIDSIISLIDKLRKDSQ